MYLFSIEVLQLPVNFQAQIPFFLRVFIRTDWLKLDFGKSNYLGSVFERLANAVSLNRPTDCIFDVWVRVIDYPVLEMPIVS